MNREQLLALLTKQLADVGHRIQFEIVEEGLRQDGSWWYVPILATRNGIELPREFSVNLYARIEDEMEQQHGVSVLFVPAVNEPAG